MPEQSTTLRDMIQEALDNGVTYRQLESRATDEETGKTASRAVFIDIVSGKATRVPYDYHLRAVAAALRKPYEEVRRAAIAQWLPAEGERPAAPRAEIADLLADAQRLREEYEAAIAKLGNASTGERARPRSA